MSPPPSRGDHLPWQGDFPEESRLSQDGRIASNTLADSASPETEPESRPQSAKQPELSQMVGSTLQSYLRPLDSSLDSSLHNEWVTSTVSMSKCDYCDMRGRKTLQQCANCMIAICKQCCDKGELDPKHHLDSSRVDWNQHLKKTREKKMVTRAGATKRRASTLPQQDRWKPRARSASNNTTNAVDIPGASASVLSESSSQPEDAHSSTHRQPSRPLAHHQQRLSLPEQPEEIFMVAPVPSRPTETPQVLRLESSISRGWAASPPVRSVIRSQPSTLEGMKHTSANQIFPGSGQIALQGASGIARAIEPARYSGNRIWPRLPTPRPQPSGIQIPSLKSPTAQVRILPTVEFKRPQPMGNQLQSADRRPPFVLGCSLSRLASILEASARDTDKENSQRFSLQYCLRHEVDRVWACRQQPGSLLQILVPSADDSKTGEQFRLLLGATYFASLRLGLERQNLARDWIVDMEQQLCREGFMAPIRTMPHRLLPL
ncbi:hypothetical protein ACJZ2D_009832 [Fusarium nematophilum]